ncbi:MAG: hypothetical protein D6830_00365 [Ignavibacteria bacterium]|nr:MAG: hypothetical protein D6830_00365 [Ignavibacteria bacterium]
MFLETLDVRKNDVLIFSKNLFDFNNNFKIVFKKDAIKRAKRISYFEVCEFVKAPIPKNLIVYRLLTNVPDLDSYSTKYGYFIKVEGRMELVYFDPIFAIKDLRHLRFNLDPEKFRFKIQQIGLSYQGKSELEANFKEVFGFDLTAQEAQHQNDKIFADAIFAFDDTFIDEDDEAISASEPSGGFLKDDANRTPLSRVSEDPDYKSHEMSKVFIDNQSATEDIRNKNIEGLKKALGITQTQTNYDYLASSRKTVDESSGGTSFSSFINDKKKDAQQDIEQIGKVPDLFSMFKTTEKKEGISPFKDRGEVTLKLDEI